ncbi:hypothetical protein ACFL6U_12270 [Planctomycetota bacterium]
MVCKTFQKVVLVGAVIVCGFLGGCKTCKELCKDETPTKEELQEITKGLAYTLGGCVDGKEFYREDPYYIKE